MHVADQVVIDEMLHMTTSQQAACTGLTHLPPPWHLYQDGVLDEGAAWTDGWACLPGPVVKAKILEVGKSWWPAAKAGSSAPETQRHPSVHPDPVAAAAVWHHPFAPPLLPPRQQPVLRRHCVPHGSWTRLLPAAPPAQLVPTQRPCKVTMQAAAITALLYSPRQLWHGLKKNH